MKYGLIVNIKTKNIGDDIQSYAMEKFLPHTDYLIDREHLDSFYTPTGEKVAALLGGWYMHKALNWPPSPFLKLLPISFHLTTVEAKKILTLTDYGAKWLKKIEPIGCRDKGTMEELKRLKIDGYFSGCATLTLKPFEDVELHGKIVLTDLSEEIVDFIRRRAVKKVAIVSHDNKQLLLPKEVVDFAAKFKNSEPSLTSHLPEIRDYSDPKSRYPGTWNYRRALVEGLLKFYQGASLVVTSRLTGALSALVLGTPVLLVKDRADLLNYKVSSFLPYLNYTTPDELFSRRYPFDFDAPAPNPKGFKKFSDAINSTCGEFINSCENSDEQKIDVELWRDVQQKNLRLKQILNMLLPGEKPLDPKFKNTALYNF